MKDVSGMIQLSVHIARYLISLQSGNVPPTTEELQLAGMLHGVWEEMVRLLSNHEDVCQGALKVFLGEDGQSTERLVKEGSIIDLDSGEIVATEEDLASAGFSIVDLYGGDENTIGSAVYNTRLSLADTGAVYKTPLFTEVSGYFGFTCHCGRHHNPPLVLRFSPSGKFLSSRFAPEEEAQPQVRRYKCPG